MTTRRGLPISQLTEFVGRDAELAELRALVSSRRLVTITGEAGVGKSRLVSRLAETMRRSFGGSIIVVDMAAHAPSAIGRALAAAVGSDDAAVCTVARTLGDRPHLIIVDDLDDAVKAGPILEELLVSTSETRLVVTSRGPTGIRGETPYLLAPLDVPSAVEAQSGPDKAGSSTELLLMRRIAEMDPTFRFIPTVTADLLAISRATEGLPRFIEAAARAVCTLGARAAALAVAESLATLDSFLPSAVNGRTSKAVLDQSVERLSAPARELLQRLSLFESGCDLRFAAELFAAGSVAGIAAPVAELIDLSLLRSDAVGHERHLRVPLLYRLHTLGRWTEEDHLREQRRVRCALLGRLRDCAAAWFSEDQLLHIQFLNRHSGDITVLLGAMSRDTGSARDALEVISSLRYYWQLHPVDPWPHVRDWIATALAADTSDDAVRVQAMQTDAYIAFQEGDLDGARAQLSCAMTDVNGEVDETTELLFGTFVEALIDLARADLHVAEQKLDCVLRSLVAAETRDHLGEKYWFLATCQAALRRETDALATVAEGIAYCERVGDDWGRAYMGWLQALVAHRHGHTGEAMEHVRDCVEVLSEFGDRVGLALCTRLLTSISALTDEHEAVDRLSSMLPPAPHGGPPVPLPELTEAANTSAERRSTDMPDQQALAEMLKHVFASDPAPEESPRRHGDDVLSAREREVAALVAEGLGNPAIAARLVLSRRTVEGHVQRILAKLGFRTRSQIAVWMVQQVGDAALGGPQS
jgi:DNA-binding CsgD family transcriptional regulator/predicted ATPase